MICQTKNKRHKCYTENEGISMWGCVPLSVERIHYLNKTKTYQELQNIQLLISLSSTVGMISVFRDDNSRDKEKGMH